MMNINSASEFDHVPEAKKPPALSVQEIKRRFLRENGLDDIDNS